MKHAISDLVAQLKNAQKSKKETIIIPNIKICSNVLNVLKDEGYIKFYTFTENSRSIIAYLKYNYNTPAITGIKVISKQSYRVYSNTKNLKPINSGLGLYIISTSKGVISDKQAKQLNTGGEILCKVW